MRRLGDEQLEALFCAHWQKTRDLIACLRLVVDAEKVGQPRAVARAGAQHRRGAREVVAARAIDRAAIVQRAQPILHRFARRAGVPVGLLLGRHGTQTVARVRYEAMWVLREVTKMSYPEIGLAIGGRSHSDAIAGVRKTEARIATDAGARARLLAFVAPRKRRAA